MNIFRPQVPYVFHPPKYSPWLAPLFRWVAKHKYLRKKFKVMDEHVEGIKAVRDLVRQGHSVLVTPNHADHADPSLLICAGQPHNLAFHFMAAREGFEKDAFSRFVMQRMGAFSVDREGADIASIKTAMSVLAQGQYPLVIFPEGEIYHHHEQLDELNEGVATILLRTAKRLGEDKPCYVVPTAIRYVNRPGIEETFSERLTWLEERIAWKPMPHLDPVERIYRLGGGLLASKEEEWLGQAHVGTLPERIEHLQNRLVDIVEEKHGKTKGSDRIPLRVKMLRNKIRKTLTDEAASLSESEEWELYHDLDKLFTAVQLYSYPAQYMKEHPSTNRIAETILKIEEDLTGEAQYLGERDAYLKFDEPLDVQAYLKEHDLNPKTGVGPVTHYIAERIQGMLEGLMIEGR